MKRRRFCLAALASACLPFVARGEDAPKPEASATPPANPPADAPAAASPDADLIGRSTFVANDVEGTSSLFPTRHIAVNDVVVFEEDITTGDDAKAIIEFRDGSTFEIGAAAQVRIDSFVFNPEENTSHKALQVTRGVFRYVSGFVASEQTANIKTSKGLMGIRGCVAAGIVDPDLPDFVYLGEGSATFTNAAGGSTLEPGNAIAVPSAATAPMAPAAMPAPVAAQALQAIDTRLPPRAAFANRPPDDEAWLKRVGAANFVPATQQRAALAGVAARPLPTVAPRGGIAGELGLLAEANRLNLFDGRQTTRTPEQAAFLARAARDNPNAAATLRRFDGESRAMHNLSVTAGTALVIRGAGHAAPSAEALRRVTAAATRANPAAAAQISRHAGETYRGADKGELNRKPGERPARDVHPQNDFERKQPSQNARPQQQERQQRPQQERQQRPQRPAPQKPPPERPQKPPPKKKGEEKDKKDQR